MAPGSRASTALPPPAAGTASPRAPEVAAGADLRRDLGGSEFEVRRGPGRRRQDIRGCVGARADALAGDARGAAAGTRSVGWHRPCCPL